MKLFRASMDLLRVSGSLSVSLARSWRSCKASFDDEGEEETGGGEGEGEVERLG